MADENKLATFKWFTDTYTCGSLDSGISETIFNNYNDYITSNKAINYKDLINPNEYSGSIANNTNFVNGEGNTKCILQSHIKELFKTNNFIFTVAFQKTTRFCYEPGDEGGNGEWKDFLYVTMLGFVAADFLPPDNIIKIKIIIYESDTDVNGKPHILYINCESLTDVYAVRDYTIYRVEIVGVSVFRPKNGIYNDVIIQPNIKYYYTINLRDYISAANKENDGYFNGSEIIRGTIIDAFYNSGDEHL
jgi:hypothetical protein